ncbi:MAG: hypothetical protein V7K21_03400 [Nostoc sp.]|uniref:hypothetical protein n=1 Tax=Nostoc sp. TaxID=1180 RepID=UPI002FFAE684
MPCTIWKFRGDRIHHFSAIATFLRSQVVDSPIDPSLAIALSTTRHSDPLLLQEVGDLISHFLRHDDFMRSHFR